MITGHSGPISCLAFGDEHLYSGSWDKTVRVHDVFKRNLNNEVLEHNSEIVDICLRQDQKEFCVSTVKGEFYCWKEGQIIRNFDYKRDIDVGRTSDDRSLQNV